MTDLATETLLALQRSPVQNDSQVGAKAAAEIESTDDSPSYLKPALIVSPRSSEFHVIPAC